MRIKISRASFPFWELIGVLLLLWPALYNGFPLLNSDLNTYLLSGILPETPFDRPITYGLFLRLATLNTYSLWAAVVVQAALFSFGAFRACRLVVPACSKAAVFVLLAGLCATTALPWTISMLLPDIFTAISFFCLLEVMAQKKPAPWLYLLYFISTATHSSHLLLFTGLLPLVALFRKRLFPYLPARPLLLRTAILFFLTGATIFTMGSALSKSSHVFFLSSMQNRGLLKPFLDKACATEHFDLCETKEALGGKTGDWFLWDGASPLYRRGDWAGEKEDFKRIIKASFADPQFRNLQFETILKSGWQQLFTFESNGFDAPFGPETPLYQTLTKHFGAAVQQAVAAARQQNGQLQATVGAFNRLQNGVVLASACVLLLLAFKSYKDSKAPWKSFLVLVLLLLAGNAFVCGGFSGVNGRYGARVMWLLPMAAGLALLYRQNTGRVQPALLGEPAPVPRRQAAAARAFSRLLQKAKTGPAGPRFSLWGVLGFLVLLWPAILNGFPILNSDAGTNIMSGIMWEMPVDRPIGYGILLRLFSLNAFSLCVAMLVQVALVNFLFFRVCKQVLPAIPERSIFLLLVALCSCTGLPWLATLIIPDIYTALSFLIVFTILVHARPPAVLYGLYFACTTTHGSQVQIFMGLLLALFFLRPLLFKQVPAKTFWGRQGLLAALTGLAVVTMVTTIQKSKDVFFISSMANRDILVPFLENACPTQNFELCDYKELLAGKSGDWFLWDGQSPLNRNGTNWPSHREAYGRIISASFADPHFRWLQVKTILEAGLRQTTDYRFGNYDHPYVSGESIYNVIHDYFPHELKQMENAGQQTGSLRPVGDFFNRLQQIAVPLSVALLLLLALTGRLHRNRAVLAFTVAAVILILGNNLVCAGFSGVNNRYGARVIWLLPMAAGMALLAKNNAKVPTEKR